MQVDNSIFNNDFRQIDRAEYIEKIREQGGQMESLLVQLLVTGEHIFQFHGMNSNLRVYSNQFSIIYISDAGGRARKQVEGQMVQMGRILDAIMLNIYSHQWDRCVQLIQITYLMCWVYNDQVNDYILS